jgi:hypothetical protein
VILVRHSEEVTAIGLFPLGKSSIVRACGPVCPFTSSGRNAAPVRTKVRIGDMDDAH